MRRVVGVLLVACGCATTTTPLSIEVKYSADAAPAPQRETLTSARIGVARFTDARPRHSTDLHEDSFVAHDANYDLGMSWRGRTFAAVTEVVQGLLVEELRHAGLVAEPLKETVPSGDTAGARAAGEREHVDVVLGGNLRELSGDAFAVEAFLVDVAGGRTLLRAPFAAHHNAGSGELTPQELVDDVMNRGFRPVSHQLVAQVAKELTALIAAGTAASTSAGTTETAPSKP